MLTSFRKVWLFKLLRRAGCDFKRLSIGHVGGGGVESLDVDPPGDLHDVGVGEWAVGVEVVAS